MKITIITKECKTKDKNATTKANAYRNLTRTQSDE